MVNTYKRSRRPRYEDTDLVDDGVCTVEGSVFSKGGVSKREKQSRSHALVDSVFRDIDEKERKHAEQC